MHPPEAGVKRSLCGRNGLNHAKHLSEADELLLVINWAEFNFRFNDTGGLNARRCRFKKKKNNLWMQDAGRDVVVSGCAVSAGSVLAVEAGGSLLCSAALKSCNDRFSAVFS